MKLRNLPWIPFALLAILTGLYPAVYYIMDMHSHGVLPSKPASLVANPFYIGTFYVHITFGGIALLIGWMQFSRKIRTGNIRLHRSIGKVYILSVLFSSTAGFIIALFANGGLVSAVGFGLLALTWLFTDIWAYRSIRKLNIPLHREWMIRNYSLTFAAVTLRIYLPLSSFVFHMDFLNAYRGIAWLCWVPNLIVAEILIRRTAGVNTASAAGAI